METTMKNRRNFIAKAGAGLIAGGAVASLAAPAIAQTQPTIKWRLASSFPKSLDTIYGAADDFSKRLAEITGGKFEVKAYAGGEIVPALQVMDAVKDGTVEMGHTAPYYFFGKQTAFAFDCAIPFGLNARQQNAWYYHGGGRELLNEFYSAYNIVTFAGGNTGVQMGGWFKKEIKELSDLKGLKFRIGGTGGKVLAPLGVVPQQIAGGDIYPALEKGTIDGAEWVGPYDDEKLGFYKVAKFYYYPGWWEGGPNLAFYVNAKELAKLPSEYRAALEACCAEANINMLAKYDAKNPAALGKLLQNGVQLRAFSKPIMDACFKSCADFLHDEASKNPEFKKIFEPWKRFRQDTFQWFSVAEANYDDYVTSTKL